MKLTVYRTDNTDPYVNLAMEEHLTFSCEEDEVILTGGDGTLNRFANDVYGMELKVPVYYVKCGSGNDFFRDNEKYVKDGRIDLRPFLKDLPLITVNGIQRRFLNGIGYGLDGETCKAGDEQKLHSDKPVNYTNIAIKLLLGGYELKKATVTVDGETNTYENVWLALLPYIKNHV